MPSTGQLLDWTFCFFLFGPLQTRHSLLTCHPQCDSSPHKETVGFPRGLGFLVISATSGCKPQPTYPTHFDLSPDCAETPPGKKCRNRGDPKGPTDLEQPLGLPDTVGSPFRVMGSSLLLLGEERGLRPPAFVQILAPDCSVIGMGVGLGFVLWLPRKCNQGGDSWE